MEPTKRELREVKRIIKRKGNQRLRRQLRQTLAENPDQANDAEFDYGRYRSSSLNGMDHDATRRRSS
ncbi:MAG: hypothetical protein P4L84_28215 [Isosphaeraceae bacterium]|nr:hypothetical protein [Isosphaeraceae bacterium]